MFRVFRHYLCRSSVFLAACDVVLLCVLFNTFGRVVAPDSTPVTALAMALAAVVGMASVGLYNRKNLFLIHQVVSRALVVLPLVLVAIVGSVGVHDWLFPEAAVPGFALLGVVGLTGFFPVAVGLRRTFIAAVDRLEGLRRRVAVIGAGRHADRLDELSRALDGRTFSVAAVVEPGQFTTTAAFVDFCQRRRIDEVVVAGAERADLPLDDLLQCKLGGVEVTPYLTFWERETGQVDLDAVSPSWLVFCDGFRGGALRAAVKRGFDIAAAAALLVASLPLTLVVALLIRLESPGPVFYRQERVGLGGRRFAILKFRSMRQDAERAGPQWAAQNDARVTRVGAVIRTLRIDEIPQAINVLRGEMSFVGPRPERPVFVDALRQSIAWYDERHRVKPGITGWAQINYPYGATEEDARNKLAYDLYYVKNASIFLDVVILLQTAKVVLWREGAR
ncbi:MAG: TIGR03013 family PEP-CTERM/XrtA system glycosyltransferase [Magnetospirillum sp.]|nr:TIGR03013 family PEP-CTERM/XrtA system glycosyltransferase [Magnetospirillum sp.]